MENPEEDYLRIIKLCFETGPAVVSAFLESNILPKYNNSLEKYIESFKHKIFHRKNPNVTCCECNPIATNRFTEKTNNEKLNLRQFYNFFIIGEKKQTHNQSKRNRTKHLGICLCKYSVKTLSLNELDLTLLAIVANVSGSLEMYQEDWISRLLQQRNKICHVPRISTLSTADLKRIWMETVDIILKIAGLIPVVYFRKSIEREIDNLKARKFYPDQSAVLLSTHLQQCVDEVQTDDELNHNVGQEKVTEETVEMPKLMVENCGKVFALVEFPGKSAQTVDVSSRCTVHGDAVNFREEIIYQRLQHNSNWETEASKTDVFQITNVEKHCIVLELQAKQYILQDSQKLHYAIKALLQTVITAGDIDQNVPTLLTFRFDNFVDIDYALEYHNANTAVKEQKKEPTVNRTDKLIYERTDTDQQKTELFKLLHPKDETIVHCQPILGLLMQVIFDLFPDIVREWLMKYYTLDELINEISQEESLLSIMSESLSPAENSLDTLYEISKNLKKIKAPENGWRQNPKDSNTSPSDDIVRIRFFAKRVKCRLNSAITVPERNQFIDQARYIASRFDKFLEKQHTFEDRLNHLSKEWEILLEYSNDGFKRSELPSVHPRTHALDIVQHLGGLRSTQRSANSVDSGISDYQYQTSLHEEDGNLSANQSAKSQTLEADQTSLHEEDGNLSANQSAKSQTLEARPMAALRRN